MAPSCAAPTLIASDVNQLEAIAACLKRLRPGHFQAKRLAFEIRDVGFTPAGTLDNLQLLVRRIFERAVADPERFAAPCAALCFSLTPILPTFKPPGAVTATAKAKRIDFRQTLLNLCQCEFEAACAASAAAPVADIESRPTTALTGSLQFLAYLYLNNLLTDRIMLSCLLMAVSVTPIGQHSGGGEQLASGTSSIFNTAYLVQRLDCLVRALLIAGRQLDECLAAQHRPLLEGLYSKLSALHQPAPDPGSDPAPPDSSAHPPLPHELRTALGQLLELRATGWARGPDATGGPPDAKAPHSAPQLHPRPNAFQKPQLNRSAASATVSNTPLVADANAEVTLATTAPGLGGKAQTSRPAVRVTVPGSSTLPLPALEPLRLHGTEPTLRCGSAHTPGRVASCTSISSCNSSSGGTGCGGEGEGMLLSRPGSQSLEGLLCLTAETYNEIRGQVLSQAVGGSAVTLEALADDLIELSLVAACVDSGNTNSDLTEVSSDPDWAAQVQRYWDEQTRACDLYVRLAADVLQHLNSMDSGSCLPSPTAATPRGSCSQDGSAPSPGARPSDTPAQAATGPVVNDTGRVLRRLLLQTAQSHFERCLSALLPPQLQPPSPTAAYAPSSSSTPSLPLRQQRSPRGTRTDHAIATVACSPRVSTASVANSLTDAWADMQADTAGGNPAAASQPRARGMCHLLLGLLRYGVITPRIVLHCAAALVDGAAAGSGVCLQCACILLVGAGKQSGSFKLTEAAAFESLIKRLNGLTEVECGAVAGVRNSEDGSGMSTANSSCGGSGMSTAGNSCGGSGMSTSNSSNGGSGISTAGSSCGGGGEGHVDAAARMERRRYVAWLTSSLR